LAEAEERDDMWAPHVIDWLNEFGYYVLNSAVGVEGKKIGSIEIPGYLNRDLGSLF
jgi:hypothetical protein